MTPGEFRRSQVWIGGTRPGTAVFVPPPVDEITECLHHFERFLRDQPEPTPPLVRSAKRLLDLASKDAHRIESLGRAASSAMAIHRVLQRQPIATAASLSTATRLTPATVNKSLVHLERLRIVSELTRKQRGRVFGYTRYTDILNEGMEPPKEPGA